MKKLPLVIITALFANFSYAQKTLYQVTGDIKNIAVTSVGDSIFFRYDQQLTDGGAYVTNMWIADSVKSRSTALGDVFAGIRYGDETYLYVVETIRKISFLKAIVENAKTHTSRLLGDAIRLPDHVIGTFVQDGSLFFLAWDEAGESLIVHEFNRLKNVSTNTYRLPLKLEWLATPDSPVDLFLEGSETNTFKGFAPVKIYRNGKLFHITVDNASTTYLIRIDTETHTVTHAKFKTDSKFDFSSYFIDGKLFRLSTDKNRIIVTVYDADTQAVLAQKALFGDEPDFLCYFRYGRRDMIHDRFKSSALVKSAGAFQALLTVSKKDGQYVLQVGTYEHAQGGVMIVSPFSLIGVAVSIIGTAIMQSVDRPGVYRYFYYSWDGVDKSMVLKSPTMEITKEKIDRFEIQSDKQGIKYKYKNYTAHKKGVVGTFYNAITDEATVVYFE